MQTSNVTLNILTLSDALISVVLLDGKTVRIFAYSSTRERSKKRSETRLKTVSESGERC